MADQTVAREGVLKIPDGSYFAYMDTGMPSALGPYTTVFCIHGLGFNHRTWKPMASTIPRSTRLIAYSERGYEGSSPYEEEDMKSSHHVNIRACKDTAAFIGTAINSFDLLSIPGSNVRLVTWSKGNKATIATYGLKNDVLSAAEKKTLEEDISELIFYDIPSGFVLASPNPHTNQRQEKATTAAGRPGPQDSVFMQTVCSYWSYPPSVLEQLRAGILTGDLVGTQLEENLASWSGFEGTTDPMGARTAVLNAAKPTPEERKFVQDALREVLMAKGVKKIKSVAPVATIPTCLEGAVRLVGIFRALEEEMGVGQKAKLQLIEGKHNHVVHAYSPKVLWIEIMA